MIVEDGTNVAGANSYVSIAQADAYHEARGNAAWAAAASSPDSTREGALIRATQWLDATYRDRYPGLRTHGRAQPLQWPRTGVVDSEDNEIPDNEIPVEIRDAVCEAALRELAAPGSLAPDYNGSQRVVREKVGDLEVQYSDGVGADDMTPVYSLIDGILSGLLGAGAGSSSSMFGTTIRI